jgi:hypothetical protein
VDDPEDVFVGRIEPVIVGDELDVFVSLGLADVVLDTSIDFEG